MQMQKYRNAFMKYLVYLNFHKNVFKRLQTNLSGLLPTFIYHSYNLCNRDLRKQ